MAGGNSRLSRRKEDAIVALLSERNVPEAARVVGVPIRTLYRCAKETSFAAAYLEARRAAYSQSVARLVQMSAAAVSTLGKIMVDPQAPAASRVRAADSILERAAKAIEIEDLGARVTALEQRSEDAKTNSK